MANRYLQGETNGGIVMTEYPGTPPLYKAKIGSNLLEATTLDDTDGIYVLDGGTPKYITFDNLRSALSLPQRILYIVLFPGRIEKTSSGNVGSMQFRLKGITGKTNEIVGIGIVGSSVFGSSGSTQLTVSEEQYDAAVNKITASMAYNVHNTGIQVGSIVVPGDPPYFYVFCEESANHNDVQVLIEVEVT